MSEKLSTKMKEVEGEYKVPDEVWKANWRDDVPEENDDEKSQIEYEFFENEDEYVNDPVDDKEESDERIRVFRAKLGSKTKKLYDLRKAM